MHGCLEQGSWRTENAVGACVGEVGVSEHADVTLWEGEVQQKGIRFPDCLVQKTHSVGDKLVRECAVVDRLLPYRGVAVDETNTIAPLVNFRILTWIITGGELVLMPSESSI